jgi:DNA uptake protein ComE-like DNA-binding protein
MKRLGFLLLSVTLAQKVPINMAALEELQTLPLTLNETEALYEYVTLQGPVKSIYDLMQVEGFSAETIQKLRPLISLELEKESQSDFQLDDNYRKIENWTSEEGANEGLVEVWLDRLAEPKNINSATWNDLMALQNVSPVDAVAVLKRIEEGTITYPKALRGAIGLSY